MYNIVIVIWVFKKEILRPLIKLGPQENGFLIQGFIKPGLDLPEAKEPLSTTDFQGGTSLWVEGSWDRKTPFFLNWFTHLLKGA